MVAEALEIVDDRFHAGDVLVGVGARFELVRRHIGNEILTKRRQPIDRVGAAPRKAHVRGENLVSRTHEVIAVESPHVDRPVRSEMHGIEKDLGAHSRARALATAATSTFVPVAFDATVHATSLVRSDNSPSRSATDSRPSSRTLHQTMRAPNRSSAIQVAMLAS